ncbi:MAG: nucleoside phosphorylase [Gammaproteobacteria bacterium]|nr:nucleoside phosphorylase [Gammaproteobacteria bacterium]
MFFDANFEPLHITATHEDMLGNNGHGRYIFLPGSNGRAKKISEMFDKITNIKTSSRGHDLYTGEITIDNTKIDVGAISTGMGTPSVDIILNELLKLGGKKFLRVGTCGLLQSKFMKGGDIALATAAVRDDHATECYIPPEYPAVASYEMVQAAINAQKTMGLTRNVHVGIMHSKDSLYAREFKQGAMQKQNTEYMETLKNAGAVASEMEASMLFTLCGMADAHRENRDLMSKDRVLAGTLCAVLGEEDDFGTPEMVTAMINDMIRLGFYTFAELHKAGW